jgi:hypothetical protein
MQTRVFPKGTKANDPTHGELAGSDCAGLVEQDGVYGAGVLRASWIRSVLIWAAMAQPITRRLWASITAAKYTHPSQVLR